jgi:hypothetical protein
MRKVFSSPLVQCARRPLRHFRERALKHTAAFIQYADKHLSILMSKAICKLFFLKFAAPKAEGNGREQICRGANFAAFNP